MSYQGSPCGQARLRRAGLYWEVDCDGEAFTDQIVRAFLTGENSQTALGVLVPEGGRLRIRKRVAASSLPEPTAVRVSGHEAGWTAWDGEVEGQKIPGALSRMENGKRQVALPFSAEEPFTPLSAALRGTPVTLEGKRYLVIETE